MNRISSYFLALLLSLGISTGHAEESEFQTATTPGGVEYGFWGKEATKPAPILFILASSIEKTLGSAYFRQAGNDLAELGYLCISIDIPDHGAQARDGKPSGLKGWADRAGKGENFVAECNARLSEVLDHLFETGAADSEKIAVCGTSRGGFLAIHFAAHDPRVKCAAAFAPMTDPAEVSEFADVKDSPMVKQLSLVNLADKLAGQPVWIVIGDHDERVSTEAAIAVARSFTAASIKHGLDSKMELRVMPEPRGHVTPAGSASAAADWIDRQISGDRDDRK